MGAVFSYSLAASGLSAPRNVFQSLMGAVFSYSEKEQSRRRSGCRFQSLMGAVFSYSNQGRRLPGLYRRGFNP